MNTSSSGAGSERTPEIYYKYQRPKGDELHLGGGRKESPKNKPQSTCHVGKLIPLLPDRAFFFFRKGGRRGDILIYRDASEFRAQLYFNHAACLRYHCFQIFQIFLPRKVASSERHLVTLQKVRQSKRREKPRLQTLRLRSIMRRKT